MTFGRYLEEEGQIKAGCFPTLWIVIVPQLVCDAWLACMQHSAF